MRLTRLPEHVDIIPINIRVEQNLILSDIKKIIELESTRSNNLHLDKSHLSTLLKRPHLITFNTGKCLFWLYLIKRNNRLCAFLVDKQLSNMWLIKSQFAPEFYQKGTLLEVNLLQIKNELASCSSMMLEEQMCLREQSLHHLLILIHDVFVINGKNISQNRLDTRYRHMIELFDKSQYEYQFYDYIEFNFKPYFQSCHLESVWYDYRPEVNYLSEIQGILLRPIENPRGQHPNYFYNVHPNLKRPNKYVEISGKQQRINFLVKKTNSLDNYQLFALDRDGQLKYIDIALINDLKTSKMLQQVLNSRPSQIFICQYDEYFKKWKPIEVSKTENPDVIYNFSEKLIEEES